MPFAPSPSHHHFYIYRWYGYHSQSWVFMALFHPQITIFIGGLLHHSQMGGLLFWLVVWNIFLFVHLFCNYHPNWLIFLIFFRGVQTTNQYCFTHIILGIQPVMWFSIPEIFQKRCQKAPKQAADSVLAHDVSHSFLTSKWGDAQWNMG